MERIFSAILYAKRRLAEPSTHAALSSLCAMAGVNIDAGPMHNALILAGVAFGTAGFFFQEQKPLTKVD